MGFVVDVHELADGGVGVFLRSRQGLVAQEFLNGAQVRAVGEKMCCKGVPQRVWVQIPIHVYEANVFLDDAANGALREAAAGVIEEHGLGVGRVAVTSAAARSLQAQLLTKRPILFERFLGFGAVGDDAFLIAFAADSKHALFLLDVGEV